MITSETLLESFVTPRSPVQLPERSAPDGVLFSDGRRVRRFMHVAGAPVLVTVSAARAGEGDAVRLAAEALDPALVEYQTGDGRASDPRMASPADLAAATERMRFALCLDEDLTDFYDSNRDDSLLAPVIARRPWARPRRQIWPWEALAWAIVAGSLDPSESARLQRRIVHRWSPRVEVSGCAEALSDIPSPQTLADAAPAELVSKGLSESRAIALARAAREVVSGRVELEDPSARDRLLLIREIEESTLQALDAEGNGDLDSIPIADPTIAKLVGRLSEFGRRATFDEVEEYFAPYAPWRGLAAAFALTGHYRAVVEGPPLRSVA